VPPNVIGVVFTPDASTLQLKKPKLPVLVLEYTPNVEQLSKRTAPAELLEATVELPELGRKQFKNRILFPLVMEYTATPVVLVSKMHPVQDMKEEVPEEVKDIPGLLAILK
jgi:hypothetical protein